MSCTRTLIKKLRSPADAVLSSVNHQTAGDAANSLLNVTVTIVGNITLPLIKQSRYFKNEYIFLTAILCAAPFCLILSAADAYAHRQNSKYLEAQNELKELELGKQKKQLINIQAGVDEKKRNELTAFLLNEIENQLQEIANGHATTKYQLNTFKKTIVALHYIHDIAECMGDWVLAIQAMPLIQEHLFFEVTTHLQMILTLIAFVYAAITRRQDIYNTIETMKGLLEIEDKKREPVPPCPKDLPLPQSEMTHPDDKENERNPLVNKEIKKPVFS